MKWCWPRAKKHIPSEGGSVPKEIDFSSYECDCGHQSHFFANTILRKPRPSVKNALFVWATPKRTSTPLFSSTERWSTSSVQRRILNGDSKEKGHAVANDRAASLRSSVQRWGGSLLSPTFNCTRSTLTADSANRRKKRGRKKGHKMSAAGRKAIAEAQRLRWQKIRARKKAG